MNEFLSRKYVRFAIIAVLYLLVVIWIGNFWLILGLGVIYDMYITEKVNWTFWKKRMEKTALLLNGLMLLFLQLLQ